MGSQLSAQERKQLAIAIANGGKTSVGNRASGMNGAIDLLSRFNDAATLAELVPSLSAYMSGAGASSVFSAASFVGILLFPVQQAINLLNASETGLKFYSYRAIAYTITAWSFDHAIPKSSPRRIANLKSGPYHSTKSVEQYQKAWADASAKTLRSVERACVERGVPKAHLKLIFKALGENKAETLCVTVLQSFEKDISGVVRNIWRNNYKTFYPH